MDTERGHLSGGRFAKGFIRLESNTSVRCKRWWSSLIAGSHQIQWERSEDDGDCAWRDVSLQDLQWE